MERVGAVIVTFQPDLQRLGELLARLNTEIAQGVVIDNASAQQGQIAKRVQHAGLEWMALHENEGLAAALNHGIAHLQGSGCTQVLLLDQDSLPQPGMVARLQSALATRADAAAAGPTQRDARTGTAAPFIRYAFPLNRKLRPAAGRNVGSDFLITSGTLLRMEALRKIGLMDAGLFIDNVDLDWCMRARAAGWALLGVADAVLEHRIGDRLHWRPGGHAAVHSPTRLYYMMRNRLLLYTRPATPVVWIAQDLPRLVLKLIGFSLVVAPRWRNFSAMLRGLRDGLAQRQGPAGG